MCCFIVLSSVEFQYQSCCGLKCPLTFVDVCNVPWRSYGCVVDAFHTYMGIANSAAIRRRSAMASASAVVGSVELIGSAATHSTLPTASLPTAAAPTKLRPTLASTLTFNSFRSGGSQFCHAELTWILSCAFCFEHLQDLT